MGRDESGGLFQWTCRLRAQCPDHYGLKATGRGPSWRSGDGTCSTACPPLGAFLRENGTNPLVWIDGIDRDVADHLHAISAARPGLKFGPIIETPDKQDNDDWDPGQAG